MPSLIVRQVDPILIAALKERARHNQRSTEAEHRALLQEVLLPHSLASHLLSIPEDPAHLDEDVFERIQKDEDRNVFS